MKSKTGTVTKYQVWGQKAKPFSSVKNKILIALILEAAYYITFIPGTLNIMDFSEFLLGNNFFASIYFLQILLIAPFLIILGLKVRKMGTGC